MTDQISTIMHREFPTLVAEMPIRQAAGLLHSSGFESAPVVDASGELIGILTQKDCFRPALQASYYRQWRGTVSDQMSSPVKTIEAETDMVTAAQMFLSEPHRSFPVQQSGRLVGMLRREDLLGAFLRLG
ncbi:CBS domain-containing protein [Microvirga guangxiensis]|uniref:CBS domain-containing protein n=1 Tax=Microvirga guangxiensis TaxID=549386 RepID=A0A1G5KBT1_9HYPH|nr:CBS domain-containing protein [Microvirga guangxiensis]SCY97518.1 CBS domain-containing protein [Microvirga guangxiensis]